MAKNEKRTNGARYRRSAAYVTELGDYIPALADAQKDFMLSRVQRTIIRVMRQEVTQRELSVWNCTSCKDIPMSRSARACTSTCPLSAGTSIAGNKR